MFDYIKSNPLIFLMIFLAIVAPQFVFGAIRVVLYVILGIIILLFIAASIFRFRMQRIQRQMQDEMNSGGAANGQNRGFSYTWSSRRGSSKKESSDGVKITVDNNTQEKKVSKSVGDYVEFEEVEKK